jgi:hypothetical protein
MFANAIAFGGLTVSMPIASLAKAVSGGATELTAQIVLAAKAVGKADGRGALGQAPIPSSMSFTVGIRRAATFIVGVAHVH